MKVLIEEIEITMKEVCTSQLLDIQNNGVSISHITLQTELEWFVKGFNSNQKCDNKYAEVPEEWVKYF